MTNAHILNNTFINVRFLSIIMHYDYGCLISPIIKNAHIVVIFSYHLITIPD